ncbi:hypothetical protein J2T60_000992 [Natronospira proteinivora]|uniref:Uncharacterized protein n=1 Tax=Natronospira proteinivora TaxID=1807133 RepID=A0ABT1GAT0_9GAMM|nr:hypothetical protein [Natronospira proteinivora]MCP1727027.1 hypothetical protein [Natronospira proteinivora]
MRLAPLRAMMITVTLGLLLACQDPGSPEDKLTALLIHPASLPAHRHQDALESLPRAFLASQAPNDRMIIAQSAGAEEAPEGTVTLLRELHLSDRPLQSTRQLRALYRWFNSQEARLENDLEDALITLGARLRESQEEQACLYLVINPDRRRVPSTDAIDWQRPPQPFSGWTAFILVPDRDTEHDAARDDWMAYLHTLGAGRMQVRTLSEPLPACR